MNVSIFKRLKKHWIINLVNIHKTIKSEALLALLPHSRTTKKDDGEEDVGLNWVSDRLKEQMGSMPITEMKKQGSMMLPQITFTQRRPTASPAGSAAADRPLSPQLGYSPKFTTWQSTTSISDRVVTWSTTREPTTTLAPSTTTESPPLRTFQKVTNSDGEVLFTTAWEEAPSRSRTTTPLPHVTDHRHHHPHQQEGHHGDHNRDSSSLAGHEHHGGSHHEGPHDDSHHHHDDNHHHDHHGHHGHHGHNGAQAAELPSIPENNEGLAATSAEMSRSERLFVEINNELAFRLYRSLLEKEKRDTENLVFSPFSAATALAMIFLGARGTTSWQMNELLRFDEMISFNPHLLYKNVAEALSNIESAACVKQLFVDKVTAAATS